MCYRCASPDVKFRCGFCGTRLCEKCAGDSSHHCAACSRDYCSGCAHNAPRKCSDCNKAGCRGCIYKCFATGEHVCLECAEKCEECNNYFKKGNTTELDCGHTVCDSCTRACTECEKSICKSCAVICHESGNIYCEDCTFECEDCNYCYANEYSSDDEDGNCCIGCHNARLERIEQEEEEEQRRQELEKLELAYLTESTDENIISTCKYVIPYFPTRFKGKPTIIPWEKINELTSTLDYQTSPTNWPMRKKPWDTSLYLGMEWELNFSASEEPQVKTAVENHLHGNYLWKRDGSLYSGGAELVLAPMTLQCLNDINFKALCEELKTAGATGFYRGEAGIHFHVSRRGIEDATMKKIMAWFMTNRRFVRRFCKRSIDSINKWAKIPYDLPKWYYGTEVERHIAINRTDKTWEFRVFRSTTRYERIKASMHFVPAIIHFAAFHSFATCAGKSGFSAFMEFLAHSDEHQFLLNYIRNEANLITSRLNDNCTDTICAASNAEFLVEIE